MIAESVREGEEEEGRISIEHFQMSLHQEKEGKLYTSESFGETLLSKAIKYG